MTDALRHVKPACRAVRAYTLAAREAPVKLNQNESPWDLPSSLKERVLAQARERPWSRYPDFDPSTLLRRLAQFADWPAEGVLAGNGSNELIEALLLVTVSAGTPVVIPQPTFALYGLMTRLLGGQAVEVPLDAELAYDVAALRRARRESGAPVTIVCSPNNPTGCALALDDVERLCDDGDGLVVIDEAYHEFSGRSVVPLLTRHPNLIVLRTFSKALGMAGLRVGYLLGAPELVREVDKARLPYNLNFFSQAAALAALDEGELLRERVARLVALREELQARLARQPGVARVFPSQANFILFELRQAAPRDVFEALLARGVLVRDVSAAPRLSRCLRVSVGAAEHNDAFLDALAEALSTLEEPQEASA